MATIRDVEPDLNYQQPFNSLEKRELESWFRRNGPNISMGRGSLNLEDRWVRMVEAAAEWIKLELICAIGILIGVVFTLLVWGR